MNIKMTKEKELSFEENLKKLEEIVKNLESGNVFLDDAINQFNEAIKLAKVCDDKLKQAEENVNKILNNNDELEDFTVQE